MTHLEHNRLAWNSESAGRGPWSIPVEPEVIRAARAGDWSVVLTPKRPVPQAWLGEIRGKEILGLASGGGQQMPVLAAVGAKVTSFDLSEEQLARDREVAEREGLEIRYVRGDMADLSVFPDASFDLVFHPISNVFVPDLSAVWREAFRVLRPGGELLAGFMNPMYFLFDHDQAERSGMLVVKYKLPYSEPASLDAEGRRRWQEGGIAYQYGHSLETQIGGQADAGFAIVGLYEDGWSDAATALNRYAPVAIATRARKP
jgi:SAM-dependent methyltransferase